jgi:hypothetical protein
VKRYFDVIFRSRQPHERNLTLLYRDFFFIFGLFFISINSSPMTTSEELTEKNLICISNRCDKKICEWILILFCCCCFVCLWIFSCEFIHLTILLTLFFHSSLFDRNFIHSQILVSRFKDKIMNFLFSLFWNASQHNIEKIYLYVEELFFDKNLNANDLI